MKELEDMFEWEKIEIPCDSEKCKGEKQTYELQALDGLSVPWRRKYIYKCLNCGKYISR